MAVFNALTTSQRIDMRAPGSYALPNLGSDWGYTPVATATRFVNENGIDGSRAVWTGSGFTYTETLQNGYLMDVPTGGTATGLTVMDGSARVVYTLSGFSLGLNAAQLSLPFIESAIFGGNDTVTGGGANDYLVGLAGNDSLNGSFGDDTLAAGTGLDSLNGGSGFDTADYSGQSATVNVSLPGANGTTTTATGNDTLTSIEGIIGSTGNDTIVGGASAVDNRFDGNAGNDSINGGAGNDTVLGGTGTDRLSGGAGVDFVDYLTAGIDRVTVNLGTGAATAVESGVTLTEQALEFENIRGSFGNDSITGSSAANQIDGASGADTLVGGAGADRLVGGEGDSVSDRLSGGSGADQYVIEYAIGSNSWDTVVELVEAGVRDSVTLVLGFNNSNFGAGSNARQYHLGAETENLLIDTRNGFFSLNFTGAGNSLDNEISVLSLPFSFNIQARLYGGAGNDTLNGSNSNDVLLGGTGIDRMTGGTGNDVYYIDHVSDVILESSGGGTDTVITKLNDYVLLDQFENLRMEALDSVINATGNSASNVMRGNLVANRIEGLGGSDNLGGGAGNDTLLGGLDNDTLLGDLGNDLLDGGEGNDTVSYAEAGVSVSVSLAAVGAQNTGSLGSDTLIGIENLTGGSQADQLTGDTLANTLVGGEGNDRLAGATGGDTLRGDGGNDTLLGGGGFDALSGGLGADLFVLDANETASFISDSILDFDRAEADRVALSQGPFAIGNGDTVINGASNRSAPGGFSTAAELVVFNQDGGFGVGNSFTAAAQIGDATAAYAVGNQRVFVVQGGQSFGSVTAAVYLFTASNADATVSASELRLIANISGSETALSTADFQFIA